MEVNQMCVVNPQPALQLSANRLCVEFTTQQRDVWWMFHNTPSLNPEKHWCAWNKIQRTQLIERICGWKLFVWSKVCSQTPHLYLVVMHKKMYLQLKMI